MFKKKAFTMAEVLIVMALIGFLFTLMIPNLVQKEGSRKYIESAQKAQTKLQEAFRKAADANDGLFPQDWESVRYSSNKSEAIVKEISKRASVMSFCGNSLQGCFATTEYRTINSIPTTILKDPMPPHQVKRSSSEYIAKQKRKSSDEYDYDANEEPKALEYMKADPEISATYFALLDGGSVAIKTNSTYCDGVILSTDPLERPYCASIYVDVNGPAIPNMLGVDVFGFYLSGNDILPMGFYGDDFSFEFNCMREKPNAGPDNGLACTAWALKNKNMEYRKCQAGTRIGWATTTRCDMPSKER
ncbi:type II secretion system protein [bacterium]|nr:type II secretion system protein [bacterium]